MNGWSEVGAGRKLGLPQLPTWSKDGATLVVGRWGRPVLRPGRLEDGTQHKYRGIFVKWYKSDVHLGRRVYRGHVFIAIFSSFF